MTTAIESAIKEAVEKEGLGCDHCFCIDTHVMTSHEGVRVHSLTYVNPIYAPHKECCNCGMKKLVITHSKKKK